ncbi:MAG TPA: hypothetical protein VEH06_10355 [Candidatus Bathyarchaeia archaeon]|jgi:hypothetical protein|nr:hypothetical protein [Candidatus Bathyarchaeia archaeon]
MVLNIEISDVLSITQTIGIIGTLLLALYFSRRQIKDLSVDTETKVLSDLDEKMHRLEEHLLERPELARVINNVQSLSPEGVYSFDVLNVFSHAHDMRERKILNDNEWHGWVEWMRTCFRLGTIKDNWKRIQESKWYDPAFEDFINKEVVAYVEREIR